MLGWVPLSDCARNVLLSGDKDIRQCILRYPSIMAVEKSWKKFDLYHILCVVLPLSWEAELNGKFSMQVVLRSICN